MDAENANDYNDVVTFIIIAIGLPLIPAAIYSLVRNDHVAPIYVINLLMSDLIQLCSLIVLETVRRDGSIHDIFKYIHLYCVMASVGFMACVALERYLVIACPLCYRFRRTTKISVAVCVIVWALPSVLLFTFSFWVRSIVPFAFIAVLLLLPLPLFIFFLGGTLKALSASKSVPPDEKRRIVGVLVLVLLFYALLFLPNTIFYFSMEHRIFDNTLDDLSFTLLKLSPLADLVLYIFMRKGAVDKVLASVCCTVDSKDNDRPTVLVMTTCIESASEKEGERMGINQKENEDK